MGTSLCPVPQVPSNKSRGTFSITSFGHRGLRVSASKPGIVPGSRCSARRRALGQPGSGRVSHIATNLQDCNMSLEHPPSPSLLCLPCPKLPTVGS